MRTIAVELGKRTYPVYIGDGILNAFGEIWIEHSLPHRAAIVTDSGVPPSCLRQMTGALRRSGVLSFVMTIPQGERQKSLLRAEALYGWLLENECDRSSAMIALGGGVVGDLTGFVAATFRRGIPYVQAPTTLLAQVESSIGGKTGLNHASSKNAVGAFHQPRFVLSDVATIRSLPRREIYCGLGELLKYAFLSEESFRFIDEHLQGIIDRDPDTLQEMLVRCVTLKARMISEDEREELSAGGRMVLNLGHTIGHVLEILSKYRLHHGEAVLLGLQWELEIARKVKIIDMESFERLSGLLQRLKFAPRIGYLSGEEIISSLFGTRPSANFILPRAIGSIEKFEIKRRFVQSVLNEKLRHCP